jgi:hypothetical protein
MIWIEKPYKILLHIVKSSSKVWKLDQFCTHFFIIQILFSLIIWVFSVDELLMIRKLKVSCVQFITLKKTFNFSFVN